MLNSNNRLFSGERVMSNIGVLFLVVTFSSYYFDPALVNPWLYATGLLLFIGNIFIGDRTTAYAYFAFFFVAFFMLISMLFRNLGSDYVGKLMIFGSGYSAALSFFRDRKYYYTKFARVVLVALLIFFTYLDATGVDSNEVFFGASRNAISVFIIIFAIMALLDPNRSGMKNVCLDITLVLWSMIIIIWSSCRSGVISIIILLIGYMISKIFAKREQSIFNKTGVVLLFVVIIFALFEYQGIMFETFFDRIYEDGVNDESRSQVVSIYLDQMDDVKALILGGQKNTQSFDFVLNNFHNSFLYLHYHIGILSILVLILFVRALVKYARDNLLSFFLLLVILLRSSTDVVCFFGPGDAVVLYFLFDSLVIRTNMLEEYSEPCLLRC